MTTTHASYIDFLRDLSRPEFDREIRQQITDSLQELVACVERALPLESNTLHACVIDDFVIQNVNLVDHECHVQFRFTASARHGVSGGKSLERISGRAETVIDDDRQVTYRGIVFAEEPAFVGHDLGGGD
jgi:hypothetical protein